jgi:hypothetical protein
VKRLLFLLVGVTIGFAGGWLAFDWPFTGSGSGQARIERSVLRAFGLDGKSASCSRRQYPTSVWDCTVSFGNSGWGHTKTTRVTEHGGSITYTPFVLD